MQELSLSSNKLSLLPPEIGALISLRRLWLDNNILSELPHEIGALTSLEELILTNNSIVSLPATVGALTKLHQLDIGDNPLVTPPPEVVAQGTEAVQSYFRELGRTGEPIFEAKIVLVGRGRGREDDAEGAADPRPFRHAGFDAGA